MVPIKNEKTKDYRVSRNQIYAGKVAKINEMVVLNGKAMFPDRVDYRSTLFTLDEKNHYIDLLYKSPTYPVHGFNDSVFQSGDIVVLDAFSLEKYIAHYKFNYFLYFGDLTCIRNLFFSSSFLRYNLPLFGLSEEMFLRTSTCTDTVVNRDIHEIFKALCNIQRICEIDKQNDSKFSIDDFEQLVDFTQYSDKQLLKKFDKRNKDIFTPVRDEKNVKKLRSI